jgi:protein tyrosine phosphatase
MREYIAAQGPKPTTSFDFWRMVLQHKCETIVMLTSLVENNKVKCHEYFPKLNGRVKFDNVRVVCVEEQKHASYIRRILEVEKVLDDDDARAKQTRI